MASTWINIEFDRRDVVSTTFEVLPGKAYIPDYRELLALANVNINAYLSKIGIHRKIKIEVNLRNITSHDLMKFDEEDKILQNETSYAWFYFPAVSGGTDCYYHRNLQINRDVWNDEIITNSDAQKYKDIIAKNMDLGYRWIFRKTGGQAALIALSYGLLAASLAKLTDGIIYSDDGAWDYSKFPVMVDEFLIWYFDPEFAAKEDDKSFSKQCISILKHEMSEY